MTRIRFGYSLAAAGVLALGLPSVALACLPYVVGGFGHDWRPIAVVEVEVTRVDAAGPDLVDRHPYGYEMTVRRTLRGADLPPTFEVSRATGCDTMNLGLGERFVVAIGRRVDLGPEPDAGLAGPDNYNSVFYHLRPNRRLELAAQSSWIERLPRDTTVEALLTASEGMPNSDVADPVDAAEGAASSARWAVFAAGLLGLLVATSRIRVRVRL